MGKHAGGVKRQLSNSKKDDIRRAVKQVVAPSKVGKKKKAMMQKHEERKIAKAHAQVTGDIVSEKTEAEILKAEEGPSQYDIFIARKLAHVNKDRRVAAVKSIEKFFIRHPDMPENDVTKLFKAIFYCYWMCDMTDRQQHIGAELAKLTYSLPTAHLRERYTRGFWNMIFREWNSIDSHRMDKFYNLIDDFIRASLKMVADEGFSLPAMDAHMDILCEFPFKLHLDTPVSIMYHVIQNHMKLLYEVMPSPGDELMMFYLQPIIVLIPQADKLLLRYIKEEGLVGSNFKSFRDYRIAAQLIFDLASSPELDDESRPRLFKTYAHMKENTDTYFKDSSKGWDSILFNDMMGEEEEEMAGFDFTEMDAESDDEEVAEGKTKASITEIDE